MDLESPNDEQPLQEQMAQRGMGLKGEGMVHKGKSPTRKGLPEGRNGYVRTSEHENYGFTPT